MLKKFVISLVVLLSVACSKNIDLNISDVSNEIVSVLNLQNLIKFSDDEITSLLYLDEGLVENGELFISETNNLDIVGIIESKDINGLSAGVKEYVNYLQQQSINYFPERVKKLEDALIVVKGNYLFLIVSDDTNKVKNIINRY